MLKNTFIFTIFLLFTLTSQAQLKTPAASPTVTISQEVGLTEVILKYSRPGVKGRKIFGEDGLIPFGEVWRTGANAATKISFSDAVFIAGQKIAKGEYALLTIPNASQWQLNIYNYEKSDWNSYVETTPVFSTTIKSSRTNKLQESLSISMEDIKDEQANLHIAWEYIRLDLPIKFEVRERVLANIDRVIAGPSIFDYFFAATYLHESGEDLPRALSYIQKATQSETPRFFFSRREALILADLGRKPEAIVAAQRSMELAKEVGNADVVRMNERSIREWKE